MQETASNAGGASSPAVSAASAVVVPPVPSNTSPPTITGAAQQGQTLTDVHGSWTNSPTSYTYQWLRCNSSGESCVLIALAAAQAYVPGAEDVGHTLRVAGDREQRRRLRQSDRLDGHAPWWCPRFRATPPCPRSPVRRSRARR